ncbi:MAG: hypothetical protein ACTHK7_00745, partial [Aureliella sp.]
VRASAQGLFNVMILGVGALVANSICPWLQQEVFTHDVPAQAAAVQPATTGGQAVSEQAPAESPAGEAASGETAPGAPASEPSSAKASTAEAPAPATVKKVDWRSLFLVPCAAATLAAIALALFFHPPKREEDATTPIGHPV